MDQNTKFLNGRVTVAVGDITRESTDAIVNAANSSLLGGGGVDGAIHRAGGSEILAECQELRRTRYQAGLPTGEAVITRAGKLPARFVIHTVGPIYGKNSGRDALLLESCYIRSLTLAAENKLHTIAFPAISTGVYGYPKKEAAIVASNAVREFLTSNPLSNLIHEVRFIFFSTADAEEFLKYQQFGG
jgi:O-acetyl-ADP-ribose deacetylase (regulator of RNase III)